MVEAMVQRDLWKETPAVKGRIARYWDSRSESFKEQRDAELHSEQHQLWEQELLSHLPQDRSLRILDVGCGCGFFTLMLAEHGHRVTGIDLTGSMIRKGRELAQEYGVAADLRVMDAEHPDFSDDTFDAIVTRNLTWTLPHPAAHRMLSGAQMDECMNIYRMLPISGWKRPDWDVCILKQMGCREVTADDRIGEKLYLHESAFSVPYPIFRIKAVKA